MTTSNSVQAQESQRKRDLKAANKESHKMRKMRRNRRGVWVSL
jgi:hypothetical protein